MNMPTSVKGLLVKLLLFGVAVIVGLILAEGAVRLVSPQETMFPRYVESRDYPFLKPENARIVHARGDEWRFVYSTNALGRRGPFITVSDDRPKVVVLGDSFTFGVGVPDDSVYTDVMARMVGDYAIVNGGVGGWGIDSQIKWYFDVGREYGPRAVVLQFTANDPFDFAGVTTIDEGRFQFHDYPAVKPDWQWALSRSRLLQLSHLYSLVREVHAALEGPVSDSPSAASPEAPQRRYSNFLQLFARELTADGVDLLFLSVTHEDRATGTYGYDVDDFPVIRATVDALAGSGYLSFLELPLEEMKTHPGSPEGHQWGSAHHRIVGRELAQEILRKESQGSSESR